MVGPLEQSREGGIANGTAGLSIVDLASVAGSRAPDGNPTGVDRRVLGSVPLRGNNGAAVANRVAPYTGPDGRPFAAVAAGSGGLFLVAEETPSLELIDDPCHQSGSDIECENQVLGESIDVVGTPYTLNYRSERVPGRASLDLPITGATVPDGVQFYDVVIEVAGQRFTRRMPAKPNQNVSFVFNQKDLQGADLSGTQQAEVEISERYGPDIFNDAITFQSSGTGDPHAGSVRHFTTPLGFWNARTVGLGGWTLSVHHYYDPVSRTLYRGDGTRRSFESMGAPVEYNGELYIADPSGTIVDVFSPSGQHQRTVHALTGTTLRNFAYEEGRLKTITDADGNQTTIHYENGQPTKISGPYQQETTLTVDAKGFLATVTNPLPDSGPPEAYSFTYTNGSGGFDGQGRGLLTSMTDPRGHTWSYQYDTAGRLEHAADPAGGAKSIERTRLANGRQTQITTAEGRTSTYEVSQEAGSPTTVEGALQQILNRKRKTTGPSGLTRESTKDLLGNTRQTAPDGTQSSTTRIPDPRFGMQAALTSSTMQTPGGRKLETSVRREVERTNPADPLSLTKLSDTVKVNGRTASRVFDKATHTLTTTSPAGRTSTTTFDTKGRPTQVAVPGLAPVTMSYDSHGRLQSTSQSNGTDTRTTTFAYYEGTGNLHTITDPMNRTVSFTYDHANRVKTQTQPDTRVISTTYDANGNVASITPPGRPAHEFNYTPINLEAEYRPPGVGSLEPGASATTYTYNKDRQLDLVHRPDGQDVDLIYDAAGRLYQQQVIPAPGSGLPAPSPTTYTYSPTTGQLTTITGPYDTNLAYDYDGSLPWKETWSGAISGSVEVDYDNDLRVTKQRVNGGNEITLDYDADGLLKQAGDLILHRDQASGLLSGTELGATTDTYDYNDFGEVKSYSASYGSNELLGFAYTRDQLGRIKTVEESVGGSVTKTRTYGYDAAGRLTDVYDAGDTNSTPIAHYQYDANGNRLAGSYTQTEAWTAAQYDDQDRLLSYTTAAGTTTFTYTANGEMQTKTLNGDVTRYSYDVMGNLVKVVLHEGAANQKAIEYLVDGRNRRVGKKVDGALTQGWLYEDQFEPVVELDGAGRVTKRFVYGSKQHVPDYVVISPVSPNDFPTVYRVIADQLGSVREVVNAETGVPVQRSEYDEWGAPSLVAGDSSSQPFGFAGGMYEPELNMIRFGGRDYHLQLGRWMSLDPVGFLGGDVNLYLYVSADPMNLIDPSGQNGARARSWARSQVGMAGYGFLDPSAESRGQYQSLLQGVGTPKCNKFVWDALEAGGDPAGRMADGRIPSAKEWGDPRVRIPGYSVVPGGAPLKPGDVISDGHHVGIYDPSESGADKTTSAAFPFTSAEAGPSGAVVNNDWGFREGQWQNRTIRRCDCDF